VPEPTEWDFACGSRFCSEATAGGELTFTSSSNFFDDGVAYVAVLAREGNAPPYVDIASSNTFIVSDFC
jgi:hypothetical protein